MTSKLKLTRKPIKVEYSGLTIWLSPEPDGLGWNKKRSEQMIEAGLVPAEINDLDDEDQSRWYGRSMVGTFVVDIEPFVIEHEDGSEVEVKFDSPSEMDMYETQGEELLGENVEIQNHLLNTIQGLVKETPNFEVRALGNSLEPVDSGK